MHDHHDHHHHDHDHHGHHHHHGPSAAVEALEEPMDAANKALGDALQVSFRILKGIMVVLVLLYLVSNLKCIQGHQNALVMRLGKLMPGAHDAGLVRAWPFPLEEVLILPTKQANTISIDSHTFFRRADEIGRDISMIYRGDHGGLDPSLDGALLTADKGLVHVEWKITYKFDEDITQFVSHIHGAERVTPEGVVLAAENLIRTIVETTGIHMATELTAEEIIRTRVSEVQAMMRDRVNDRLRDLQSGVRVTSVEMKDPTPPLQVREAFNQTQISENAKKRAIDAADGQAISLKNQTAGAIHAEIITVLDALASASEENRPALKARLDEILMGGQLGGDAGRMISNAQSYYSREVGQMRSDVEEYEKLLPEYKRNPALLISRKWEEARDQILNNPYTVKIYIPRGLGLFRIRIGRDPLQMREDEARDFQTGGARDIKASELLPEYYHPMNTEFE